VYFSDVQSTFQGQEYRRSSQEMKNDGFFPRDFR